MFETETPDARTAAEPTPARTDLAPAFFCETLVVDERAVVALRGDLDLASAPRCHRQLSELLAPPISTVTLDLADLSFIDSSGLGVLVATLQEAREQGIRLELDRVPAHARRVLEITGLTCLFHLP